MKFEIKKSKIKGAGKGTFATEEYWPGEIVGNFEVEYSHTESRFTYFYHDARLEVVNELKYGIDAKSLKEYAILLGTNILRRWSSSLTL